MWRVVETDRSSLDMGALRGASASGEPGIVVLFEVTPEKVIRDAARLGWDLALERDNRLKIIFTTRAVFRQELQQADSLLLDPTLMRGTLSIETTPGRGTTLVITVPSDLGTTAGCGGADGRSSG